MPRETRSDSNARNGEKGSGGARFAVPFLDGLWRRYRQRSTASALGPPIFHLDGRMPEFGAIVRFSYRQTALRRVRVGPPEFRLCGAWSYDGADGPIGSAHAYARYESPAPGRLAPGQTFAADVAFALPSPSAVAAGRDALPTDSDVWLTLWIESLVTVDGGAACRASQDLRSGVIAPTKPSPEPEGEATRRDAFAAQAMELRLIAQDPDRAAARMIALHGDRAAARALEYAHSFYEITDKGASAVWRVIAERCAEPPR